MSYLRNTDAVVCPDIFIATDSATPTELLERRIVRPLGFLSQTRLAPFGRRNGTQHEWAIHFFRLDSCQEPGKLSVLILPRGKEGVTAARWY